jgi:hypothetical protein
MEIPIFGKTVFSKEIFSLRKRGKRCKTGRYTEGFLRKPTFDRYFGMKV